MSELEEARRQRKAYRSRATRSINEADKILGNPTPNLGEIMTLIQTLELVNNQLDNVNTVIQASLNEDDYLRDDEECFTRQTENLKRINSLKVSLEKLQREANPTPTLALGTHREPELFKLPTKRLPSFSGNILEFRNFMEVFETNVEGKGYSDINKLNLLLDCLKGTAHKLVSGYNVTGSNYRTIVDLLKKDFDNPSKVIETLITKLTTLSTPKFNYTELYQFKADIHCYVESLKTKEMIGNCSSCSTILGVQLAKKLPPQIHEKVRWENAGKNWNLESLLEMLTQALTVLEASGQTLSFDTKEDKSNSKKSDHLSPFENKWKYTGAKPKQSTVLTTTQHKPPSPNKSFDKQSNNNKANNRIKCRFCSHQHYPSECTLLVTPEIRRQVVQTNKWCFKCLSTYHSTSECESVKTCFKCRSPDHHTALCLQTERQEQIHTDQSLTTLISQINGVALPIADLAIYKGKEPIMVRSLYDQCSQKTLVAKSVVRVLNCTPHSKINIVINGINKRGVPSEHDVVNLNIGTKEGIIPVSAIVVDHLPNELNIPGLVHTTKLLRNNHIDLANPYPPSDKVSDIGLLIGCDCLDLFLKSYRKFRNINLMETNVGNLIWGELPFASSDSNSQVTIVSSLRTEVGLIEDINISCLTSGNLLTNKDYSPSPHSASEEKALSRSSLNDKDLTFSPLTEDEDGNSLNYINDVDRLWSLSHIGILPNEPFTDAEKTTLESFKNNLRFEDGRYVVSLPWRENHPSLPDNYSLSKRRLYSVLKRLRAEPQLLKPYDDVIKEQLARDFIEEVTPVTPFHPESKLHYLPHHGVRKSSSTTSLRLVYDCSARTGNNPSLNNCLYSGPSLIIDLGKLLLKFRIKPYATSSDIEKAFLGIRLSEKDRDSTRFLWVKDPSDPNSPIITYRFKSVLFGATCSPFLLAACLQHHVNQSENAHKDVILDHIYVDNLFGTFETEDEINQYFLDTRSLFSKAGLNLREWTSNSSLATSMFKEQNLGIEGSLVKVLGMEWDTSSDTMSYPTRSFDPEANTKRKILRNVASAFDPLGILSPVVIRGKMLLQELFKGKLDWDTKIPIELQKEWKSLSLQLQNCLNLKLPRQLIHSPEVELHAFSDASRSAYGTVIYVVSCLDTAPIAHILIAKVKVSPIKELSIPRLELMGALLSSRLLKFVLSTFHDVLTFRNVYAWCDSQCTLQWIHSSKQLPTFNQNRVDEIRKNVPSAVWKYVSTGDNPADLASRGSNSKYILSDLWRSGPSWLLDPSNWPVWKDHPLSSSPREGEEYTITTTTVELPQMTSILNLEFYSSFHKVLRITKLIFRFIDNLKKSKDKEPLKKSIFKPTFSHQFSIEENQNAESYWIRIIQREHFNSEITHIENDLTLTPLCKQLSLILVDGILRCDRRLGNSLLPYDTKFPILLPCNCKFTSLLVWDSHLSFHHLGTSELLLIIRRKYYFSRMRTTIKRVTRPCVLCKRLQSVHFRSAPLAALPKTRVTESRPFTVIGVDLTGHFTVKTPKNCTTKCYIVLFTCAVTRAVHLEIVLDNSAESFLRSLRRFIGRRFTPSIIYSDNATYFQASSQYLKQLHSLPSVRDFLTNYSISWRFNPARSSHYGGFFERLIGLTKLHLKRTFNTALVTYEEFYTVLIEVESVLNCRPLTFVGDELHCDEPLTPSHLLTGYKLNALPIPGELLETDPTFQDPVKLNKRYRYLLSLINNFQIAWERDYLVNLRQSWNAPGRANVSIGDVVLIEGDGPRLKWKLGVIKKLHTSPDGYVRSVSLNTKNGEITRAVIHLYPLEINSRIFDSPPLEESLTNLNSHPRRSERQAHALARQRIRAILEKE